MENTALGMWPTTFYRVDFAVVSQSHYFNFEFNRKSHWGISLKYNRTSLKKSHNYFTANFILLWDIISFGAKTSCFLFRICCQEFQVIVWGSPFLRYLLRCAIKKLSSNLSRKFMGLKIQKTMHR